MSPKRTAEVTIHLIDYPQVSEALKAAVEIVAIVRNLGEGTAPYDHEYGECLLCDKVSRGDPIDPKDHNPECPWRLAREWVQAHPVEEAGE